jgi:O-acetyl-ADP-ribose deacetylase (regulator of RNase III)
VSVRGRIRLVRDDITRLAVDAIVNAANERLLGGGGVDGAIHRAAGPGLREECRRLGGCPTGEVRITGGHALPARFVLHAVGPVWRGGGAGEEALLAACYRNALAVAAAHGIGTIAFPAISCGVYGFPIPGACRIALRELTTFLERERLPREVWLVAFDAEVYAEYAALLSC